MFKTKLLGLLTVSLVGCGTVEPYSHYNTELMGYVNKVYSILDRDALLRDNLLVIDFDTAEPLPKSYLGVCRDVLYRQSGYVSKQIIISADWWRELDEPTRLLVVAHELGHCQWDLPHNPQAYTLMSPKIGINSWSMEHATLLIKDGLQP